MLFEDLKEIFSDKETVAIFCPGPTLRSLKSDMAELIPAGWPKIVCGSALNHGSLKGNADYWVTSGKFHWRWGGVLHKEDNSN